jgi:tetratricopeptide (TPR) repeat protein
MQQHYFKSIKWIVASLVALGVGTIPLNPPATLSLLGQDGFGGVAAWAQGENSLEQLLQQAAQQTQQGQHTQAIESFQQVLTIARQLQVKKSEAVALLGIGYNYDAIGQRQPALDAYAEALVIFREIKDRRGEAATLNNIGLVYDGIGQPSEALKYYQQALPIRREVQDRGGEAATLNSIGAVYHAIGQPSEALKYYQQALPISREVQDRGGEATTLNNIGLVYHAIGQPNEALKYYQQALPIRREVQDRGGEATTLSNIGAVYDAIGQPSEALKYYQQALPIFREVQNRGGEATTLNNIGEVYRAIGQPSEALKYYQQALPIVREVQDRGGEATTLNNIGAVYRAIGQPSEALKYLQQALPIRREVQDRGGEATTLNNIGEVYRAIGQPSEALKYYQQALPIFREVQDRGGEATTLSNIGLVYDAIGQPSEALKYYQQALSIFREVQNRGGEATTLSNLAAAYRDTNNPTEAINHWEKSLTITLDIRKGLQRDLRKSFIEDNRGSAVALADLLIDQKQPEKAYEWIELVTTAELANYNRLINAKVNDPEAQAALDAWNQKNEQLEFQRQQLQENFSKELSRQIRQLEAEVYAEAETLGKKYPSIAELFETTPTDIATLRRNIPQGTLVLHPVLLTNIQNVPDTVALFLLTQDSFQVVKHPIDAKMLASLIDDYYQQLKNYYNTEFLTTSQQLYDLLIRPVEAEIAAISPQTLAIIAPNKLRYIPFETLHDGEQFLIEKYPIHYLTRITRISSQGMTKSPFSDLNLVSLSSMLLMFGLVNVIGFRKLGIIRGSIIFGISLVGISTYYLLSTFEAERILALGNPVAEKPFNLDGAETEVKTLGELLKGSQVYVREAATLERFKDESPQFPILHLATHGCFQPLGCCLSNNCQDYAPDMQANTLLFANRKFFNIADAALLGLKDTQLITLSACQTAMNSYLEGQEISGVAYVLERAGARAVMATLWNVDDARTQNLMADFYQNLAAGNSQAAALRDAKVKMVDKNLHPYFWSPFVLIGSSGY